MAFCVRNDGLLNFIIVGLCQDWSVLVLIVNFHAEEAACNVSQAEYLMEP